MASFLQLVLVLVALRLSSCRLVPSSKAAEAPAGGLAHHTARTLQQDAAAANQADAPSLSQVVEGRYIVMFTPEAGAAPVAAGQLANELKTLSSTHTVAAASAGAADDFEIVSSLGSSNSATVSAKSVAAAASSSSSKGVQGLVIKASAKTVKQIRTSRLVSAVFPDLFVAAQVDRCVGPLALAAGIRFTPTNNFKWPKCVTGQSAQLVWFGEPCGPNRNSIRYTRVQAVDISSQSVLSTAANGNLPCVLALDLKRPLFSKQRFGACGVAPTFAPNIPTRLCTPTAASPAPSSPVASPSPSPNPVDAQTPVPAPVPEPNPSPAPSTEGAHSGPALERTPVLPGEQVPSGVSRIEAVTASGAVNTAGLPTANQVVVGVLDSGVDGTHPDINLIGGNTWVTASMAGDSSEHDVDKYGHGTHVAGTIGAKNNGAGVVGVSAGVPIYSIKVLDGAGKGALSSVINAVKWVAGPEGQALGIKVINLSLSAFVDPSSEDYAATRDAVCAVFKEASDAGVIVTVAAGNYGSSMIGYLPASCPTVVAVTAMDPARNTAAVFSNFMPANADSSELARVVAAPGVDILSTVSYAKDASGYKSLSGTSMASPHVAGIAANCIMSGACASAATGLDKVALIQAAARERSSQAPGFGFRGDADSTINGKCLGLLAWAKF